jgi:hypothetical protein
LIGLDTPKREVTIEGREHRADAVGLDELHSLDQRVVAGQDCAADRIAVPIEELGGTIDHRVGTEGEWLLTGGAREGVIDRQQRLTVLDEAGERFDVTQFQQGVRRGFHPEQCRLGGHRVGNDPGIGRVDVLDFDPEPRKQVVEQDPGAPIQRVEREDVIARFQGSETETGNRRGPRGEGHPVIGVL